MGVLCRWAGQARSAKFGLADPRKQSTLLLSASLVLKIMEWKYTHNTNMPEKLSFQQLELKFFIFCDVHTHTMALGNRGLWAKLCVHMLELWSVSPRVIRSVICNEIVWWPALKYLTEVLMVRWSVWMTRGWQFHPPLRLWDYWDAGLSAGWCCLCACLFFSSRPSCDMWPGSDCWMGRPCLCLLR